MNWYVAVLRKYAVFTGRAGRPEFWISAAVNLVIQIVLSAVDELVLDRGSVLVLGTPLPTPGLLSTIYSIAVFLPSIAVTVRRLHDTGRSGWWLAVGLVPLVGVVILLVVLAQPGEPRPNRFGAKAPGLPSTVRV